MVILERKDHCALEDSLHLVVGFKLAAGKGLSLCKSIGLFLGGVDQTAAPMTSARQTLGLAGGAKELETRTGENELVSGCILATTNKQESSIP